jgi:type I restriction enzyme S subunit
MSKLKPYNNYQPVTYDYISQLPDGWQLLPNIAIFQERIERGYENEELLSVTIGRGVIKQADLDKKDSSTLDKSKYLLVYPDDLVYSMRFRQGASGYSNYKGIVSPACTVLKPRKGIKYNPRYFHYMFRTGFYKNYAERYAYGIADGQMPLRYVDFKRMYSIVPPLTVQNSIVAYLDKKNNEIDKFIRNKERLIELLVLEKDTITKKLVTRGINENDSFKETDIYWIKEVPKHWDIKPFKIAFKENKIKNDFKEDYPVLSLSYGNVVFKDHDSNMGLVPQNYDSYQIINPQTLVFRFTDLQNDHKSLRVGLAKNKGIITSAYLAVIKQSKIKLSMDYAYLLLHSYDIDKVFYQFGGGVRQAIGFPDVKQLPILLPPLDEQNQIVTELLIQTQKINQLIAKAEKEISSIKEYREALITDLVTGKRSVPQLHII